MSVQFRENGNELETPYGWVTIASRSERYFLKAWNARYGKSKLFHLSHQYEIESGKRARIGNYRIDFVNLPARLAIEIDGYEHQRFPEIIDEDRKRQEKIEARGWHFIRFPTWKVYKQTAECINEAASYIYKQWELVVWQQKEPRYHPGDIVFLNDYLGEGVVLKSEVGVDKSELPSLTTEFVTVRFRDKTLRLNTDYAKLEIWP